MKKSSLTRNHFLELLSHHYTKSVIAFPTMLHSIAVDALFFSALFFLARCSFSRVVLLFIQVFILAISQELKFAYVVILHS